MEMEKEIRKKIERPTMVAFGDSFNLNLVRYSRIDIETNSEIRRLGNAFSI